MIELLIVFAVGYWLGHRMATLIHIMSFKKILDELGIKRSDMLRLAERNGLDLPEEQQTKSTAEIIVDVKLEQHQGQIYAFRKDNDQFLGQGSTAETLIERLNQTMKPCRVVVAKEDGADLLLNNNSQNG